MKLEENFLSINTLFMCLVYLSNKKIKIKKLKGNTNLLEKKKFTTVASLTIIFLIFSNFIMNFKFKYKKEN